ncbi:zinc finger protein 271 isoform X1 [Anabrus simplex]|uniref:zinc finger protein 271 isoform X1 n=1 Tax=Anabrus simplex TaxID=316456 RepID=UPI0035A280DF
MFQCEVFGSDLHAQYRLNLHQTFKMDMKIKIKDEPVYIEETASTSYEEDHLLSGMTHLKEECKSELAEPGPTQENIVEPAANIKDEVITEDHTVDELISYFKEENSVEDVTLSTIHTGEMIYQCTVCCMEFSQEFDLKKHKLTHSGHKPFQCTLCPSAFSRKPDLNRHSKIHSGDKPFSCIVCYSRFRDRSNLNQHMRCHLDLRPYFCALCNASFRRNSDLKRHMLVHSDERPYCCNICNRTFREKSKLGQHMIIHSKLRPYHCSFCSSTFYRKPDLVRHSQVHSGENS